jgi:hypothetical protein
MQNIKHVALIVHRIEDLWQGTRSALGLAVGNYYSYLFLLDVPPDLTEAMRENVEWLVDEMECECYSNVKFPGEELIQFLPTEEIAKKLKKMDILVPFGNKAEAPAGRMPILWLVDIEEEPAETAEVQA